MKEYKNKLLWTFISIAIAALTIWAVMSQGKTFSFEAFVDFLVNANPTYIFVTILMMLIYISTGGLALLSLCKSFGYKKKFGNGFAYMSADLYFSAITPSATGGQPASAFFMIKDGINSEFVTVALISNLMMFNIGTVIIGGICLLANATIITSFGLISKILIAIGFIIQISLCAIFLLLLNKPKILHVICSGFIKFLSKIRIIKNAEKHRTKLEEWINGYSQHAKLLNGRKKLLIKVFFYNLAQRVSQAFITVLTYLATGGSIKRIFDVFCIHIFTMMGAYCIPIPGAMGVTDYLLIDGFGQITSMQNAVNLDLLSRTFSFYLCIIVCGITVLIKYLSYKRRKNK